MLFTVPLEHYVIAAYRLVLRSHSLEQSPNQIHGAQIMVTPKSISFMKQISFIKKQTFVIVKNMHN